MVLKQVGTTLEKLGVEAFGEEGETFNPNIHNAVMHEENPDVGENVITAVFQKGYKKGKSCKLTARISIGYPRRKP